MGYCIIKDTLDVLDSHQDDETMLKSALNSGFEESEVEMLTEEVYLARKELEPKPIREPTTEERLQQTEDTILFLLMNGGM